MKKFKEYVTETFGGHGYRAAYLSEALNSSQKAVVDSWGHHDTAENLSAHVIPKGQSRISIPLEHPNDKPVVPHPDVAAHLESNGYKIHDYKAGFAKDKYDRQVSIGKVLNKTKAPAHVTHAFLTDPQRKATQNPTKVIISRHPHDVAGMSTDRGWASCMKMPPAGKGSGGGINHHYLQHDITQGTHVAYLVNHNDDNIERPIARIALKPFHSDDGQHTILHPEEASYGTSDSAFHHTVKKWANEHFPKREDATYVKDNRVYHDSGSHRIKSFKNMMTSHDPDEREDAFRSHADRITPEHIDAGMKDKDYSVRAAAVAHPMAQEHHLDAAMKDESPSVRSAAVAHPNATTAHIEQGLSDSSEGVRKHAVSNPKATTEQIEKGLNDPTERVRRHAVLNPNVTHEQLNKVMSHPDPDTRINALYSPKANESHFAKALDDESFGVRQNAAELSKSAENITKASKDQYPAVRKAAAMNKNATPQHLDALLKDDNKLVRHVAVRNPNMNSANLHAAISSDDVDTVRKAAEHPKLRPEHIDKLLDHKDSYIRELGMEHPNASAENIHKGLNDKFTGVRYNAVRHPNATPENLHTAMDHKDSTMRSLAIEHPNSDATHLDKAVRDSDGVVRQMAAEHQATQPHHVEHLYYHGDVGDKKFALHSDKATESMLTHALSSDNHHVRAYAAQNPNLTPAHVDKALNDPNATVRANALTSKHVSDEHLMKAVQDPDEGVAQNALRRSPNIKPAHLLKALDHPSKNVQATAAYHANADKSVIDKAISNPEPTIRESGYSNKNASDEHLMKGLTDHSANQQMRYNPRVNGAFLNRAMDHPDHEVRAAAVQHSNATHEAFEKGMKDSHEDVRRGAVLSKHFDPDKHMETALNDKSTHVSIAAAVIHGLKMSSDQISKGMKSPDPKMRAASIFNSRGPNITPEHIQAGLKDESPLVRYHAINSKHVTDDQLVHHAENDPDEKVRKTARENHNVRNIKF